MSLMTHKLLPKAAANSVKYLSNTDSTRPSWAMFCAEDCGMDRPDEADQLAVAAMLCCLCLDSGATQSLRSTLYALARRRLFPPPANAPAPATAPAPAPAIVLLEPPPRFALRGLFRSGVLD